jgi:hypothetical protein
VNHLVDESESEWYSTNAQNSWIQWRVAGGVKVLFCVDRVKIRGRPNCYRVVNFQIQGSNDGELWETIIDSKTCMLNVVDHVTEARVVQGHTGLRPFPMIRLIQTGKNINSGTPNDHLVLTYVDFGGSVIIPPS